MYQGRRLGSWLRGHPKEYVPAVHAVGTNALPYLLAELQATDSEPARFVERMLAKVSMGPFWRTARDRHYRARLALQILDTNAVPALMNMMFSQPIRMEDGNAAWSASSALTFVDSPAAKVQISERLSDAMRSTDVEQRRNACLALPVGPDPGEELARLLIACSADTNATVRAAAMRALIFNVWRNEIVIPALISRLEDEQAKVRRLAIVTLSIRKTNAAAAVLPLNIAYSNELTRPSLRDDLGDGVPFRGYTNALSAREIRRAIREAIKIIDPNAPLPVDPP
jgi:HEAT repeat protein